MKSILNALFWAVTAVGFAGCGSSAVQNSAATNSNINSVNTATISPVNSVNDVPPSGITANDVNSNSMSALTNRRPISIVNNQGPAPTIPTRPAAEDSEVATTMNKEGMVIETRTFHSHPQLAKIEMLWKSPTDKKLTIFLKNGKKVETTGDQIDNFGTVPTQTLLELAGIKATVPSKPMEPSKVQKKPPVQ